MHPNMDLCAFKKLALGGLALAVPLLAASTTTWAQGRGGQVPPGLAPELVEVFKRHTHYRLKHCVTPLIWTWQLANVAQRWANFCKRDPNNLQRFAHSGNRYAGEMSVEEMSAIIDAAE